MPQLVSNGFGDHLVNKVVSSLDALLKLSTADLLLQ